jgi:carbonic anhydrase/acetyltransferase-like protein (isoleucine patch superfamily)
MGAASICLPGAQLAEGARIGALSLVMKGEVIPAGSRWTGSPAQCDASRLA